MCQFITGNHKLPIETGRWHNIDRNKRKCNLFNEQIGDEYHYILEWTALADDRKRLIKKKLTKTPNVLKFIELMTSGDKSSLLYLSKMLRIVNKRASPLN